MIRPQSSPGFTLLELMIATSLGLAVVLVAALGYRAAAAAMSAAQRLSRENIAIGGGLSAAFTELDQWRFYDDPDALTGSMPHPERQSLRNNHITTLADSFEYQPATPQPSSAKKTVNAQPYQYQFGLPFTPFHNTWGPLAGVPSQNFGVPTGVPTATTGWLNDDSAEERAWSISASNPLTFWNAQLNSTYGKQSYMRRGFYSIGGSTSFPGNSPFNNIGGGIPSLDFSHGVLNGGAYTSYGKIPLVNTVDPISDMKNNQLLFTGNWLFNQICGLDLSLGYYGMLDYLTAGTPPCYPIATPTGAAFISAAQDIHSPTCVDGEGFPCFSTYGYYWPGGNSFDISNFCNNPIFNRVNAPTDSNNYMKMGFYDFQALNYMFFNYAMAQSYHATFPVLPSRNLLLNPGGFAVTPWCNEWEQAGVKILNSAGVLAPIPLVADPTSKYLAFYNRSYFILGENTDGNFQAGNSVKFSYLFEPSLDGPLNGLCTAPIVDGGWNKFILVIGTTPGTSGSNDGLYFSKYLRRITGTMRLLPVRPADWPDINVSVLRQVRQNRFSNVSDVSWFDPVTAQKYDLRFTAMGTTLRGARRQRSLDQ